MKTDNQHMRIYAGGWTDNVQTQRTGGQNQNRHSIAAAFSRRQNSQDKVAQKKQDAREKAMKLISNVFDADKSIDDDLARRADRIEESKKRILEAQAEIRGYDERQKEYMEKYGVEPDSQEQQDLELLRKRRDSMKPDSKTILTEEEQERLAEIDAEGMTEYQKLSLENDSYKEPFLTEIKENQKIVLEEQVTIREIGLERLKSHPMVDAAKQAEAEMAAANKEIIGMALDDAKDKVDEDMEEVKEELADAREEQEQEEERIEELRQRMEEMEAAAEERRAENKHRTEPVDLPTDRILELDSIKTDVQREVDNMLFEMKLLTEDLKGTVVDAEL